MNWIPIAVLVLLVGYILSETMTVEGFRPLRTDVAEEEYGWTRDPRYKAANVDIQGVGVGTDFCRAVSRGTDATLRISCALGGREGMNTMEANTLTVAEGFRMSRDDYWKMRGKRANYCRILKGDIGWYSSCVIPGFRGEERDTTPGPEIQDLLDAYEGILVWWRWRDDEENYANRNIVYAIQGRPAFPTLLNATVSRGLELNRWPAQQGVKPPLRDFLQWGEHGDSMNNEQSGYLKGARSDLIFGDPRSIRAIACWVWWDALEKDATILEMGNPSPLGKRDRIVLGIEGGGPPIAPDELTPAERLQKIIDRPVVTTCVQPAQEFSPAALQASCPEIEPRRRATMDPVGATYYFEIWDEDQRIMRLTALMDSARVGQWQHVVVTTTGYEDWWPTWQFWINGVKVAETVGRMSPALVLSENFIGRRMRGCIRDFRMYSTPFGDRIADAMAWSKPTLHPNP